MIFAHFLVPEVNEANMFLIACPKDRVAMLIDAAAYDQRIPEFLQRHDLRLAAVFITHAHYDHVGALTEIVDKYEPTVYAGIGNINAVSTKVVRHDDLIPLGSIETRVVQLHGHTPTAIGLVVPGMVFTGDALFAGSIGGTTSLHDKATEIHNIRENLFTLPDDYLVHTGHGPSSTIAVEKKYNPFFV